MEQSLERTLDLAESVVATAQQRPPKRKHSPSGEKSLYEKLYDIYVEESEKEPVVAEELRSNVNLLEKLLMRESLPCLQISLHSAKQGYSLMLKGENDSFIESIRLPYEEGELLEYLDAQELPPVLVDLLEKSPVNVFHQGCVIAEIRDYRQSSEGEPLSYQSRHILLRPTMQTLACDVEAIASDNQNWTQEDKLLLESQLILATAEPLCLDPSVSVACTENRLLYNQQKLNTLPMKTSLKRFSTASLNRQQDLPPCPLSPELTALISFTERGESEKDKQYDLKTLKAGKCVDMWKQRPCDLAVPSEVDVEKYSMSFKHDDLEPTVWPTYEVGEDSIFGYEDSSHSKAMKQMLMDSLNDPFISGKRRSHKKKIKVRYERQMSPHYSFTDDLPSSFLSWPETDDMMLISPFEESFLKSAQCPVQMSHSSGDLADLRQPPPGEKLEQPKNGSVQSSVLGKGAKHPPSPIRLPLNPVKRSWSDSFTPQQASSSHKFPSPASAPKLPSLSQKSSMEVNQVSSLPAMALSTVGSSQRTEASAASSGLNITKEVHPGGRGQALGSGSKSVWDSTTVPAGIKPSPLPTGIKLELLPTGIKSGLLPTGINLGPLSTGIKPGPLPTGMKPEPLPTGTKLDYQTIGIKSGPLPTGIKPGTLHTGMKPGTLSTGMKLDHQPTGIKPGPQLIGIKPSLRLREIKPRPLHTGTKFEQQPAGIKPSPQPMEIKHRPLPTGIKPRLAPREIKPKLLPTGIKPVLLSTGIQPGTLLTEILPSPLPAGIKPDTQLTGIQLDTLPTGIQPGPLPAGAQPPNMQTTALPVSSQGGVQLVQNAPSLMPLTLLQLPPGSLILNTQEQAQEQLQQLTHQWLYQLIPQPQQQPTTSCPPQLVPQAPVEGSVSQMASSAQQAMVVNLSNVGSLLQSQAVVLSHVGSAQSAPQPRLPQHGGQLASTLQLHPQPRPVQFRILQHPVAVATVTPAAQPQPPSEQTDSKPVKR